MPLTIFMSIMSFVMGYMIHDMIKEGQSLANYLQGLTDGLDSVTNHVNNMVEEEKKKETDFIKDSFCNDEEWDITQSHEFLDIFTHKGRSVMDDIYLENPDVVRSVLQGEGVSENEIDMLEEEWEEVEKRGY